MYGKSALRDFVSVIVIGILLLLYSMCWFGYAKRLQRYYGALGKRSGKTMLNIDDGFTELLMTSLRHWWQIWEFVPRRCHQNLDVVNNIQKTYFFIQGHCILQAPMFKNFNKNTLPFNISIAIKPIDRGGRGPNRLRRLQFALFDNTHSYSKYWILSIVITPT